MGRNGSYCQLTIPNEVVVRLNYDLEQLELLNYFGECGISIGENLLHQNHIQVDLGNLAAQYEELANALKEEVKFSISCFAVSLPVVLIRK